MLLGYFLDDFRMVPIASIVTDITTVFIYHMCPISVVCFFFILGSSRHLIFMTFFS
jgi:hypothetical protein